MIKGYVIGHFLTEKNIEDIKSAAQQYGYDLEFFTTEEAARGNISDGEIIYCQHPVLLNEMPKLRWCQTANAGVDAYVKSGFFDDGKVVLTNCSGAYGRAIAEYIIMVTMMMMRHAVTYADACRDGKWFRDLSIRSITDSKVAIVGTGDLGVNAAIRFKGLGAKSVIGFNRSGRTVEGFDETHTIDELDDYLSDIDVLVLCVPGTPKTVGLLSEERIAKLPSTAYVVNVGRGTAIDQDALIRALNEDRLAGAALDVMVPEPLPMDSALRTAKNCILTPHISGDMGLQFTVDTTVEIFCENLKRFAAGETLANIVNVNTGY